MKIKSFHIYQYKLPCIRAFTLDRKKSFFRSGFICSISTDEGAQALGEVAPLPGRSDFSFEDTLDQLLELRKFLSDKDLPEIFNEDTFDAWFHPISPSPAARFGLETACLYLLTQVKKTVPQHLLSKPCAKEISVSGLLTGSTNALTQETEKLLDHGHTSFKLKVGKNIKEDIARVRTVLNITCGKATVHVDANQAWSFDDAVSFANTFGPEMIAYIEEPFHKTEMIPEFYEKTGLPVAVDESLTLDQAPIHGAQIWVLKPTCIGGIFSALRQLTLARLSGRKVVISSSFESDVGLSTLTLLAGIDGEFQMPAGLDTQKFFAKNLLKDPPVFNQGRVSIVEHNLTENDLDMSLLKTIV
ncbi:MAG: o-succinylbenzoate synthase [Chlamydiota bacterium]|nr:o-succinylbenzoate synthase [Chlamydiota bacterium]